LSRSRGDVWKLAPSLSAISAVTDVRSVDDPFDDLHVTAEVKGELLLAHAQGLEELLVQISTQGSSVAASFLGCASI